MRIVSWNVRGLGLRRKKDAVKSFLDTHHFDLVILIESKLSVVNSYIIRRLWHRADIGFHYVPADGSKGGIIIMWDRQMITASLPNNTIFTCSVQIQGSINRASWRLTAVYGPVIDNLKLEFLTELLDIRNQSTGPWILIGDFNLLRFSFEKKGGTTITNHMRRFNHTIATLNLSELPLRGAKFTWISSSDSMIRSKIDRCFCDEEWEILFPTAQLSALSKPISDHIPIQLEFGPKQSGPIPFRYCSWWLKTQGAIDLLEGWWLSTQPTGLPGVRLWKKLIHLKAQLKSWRRVVDVERKRKSREILAQIQRLDLQEEDNTLSPVEILERDQLKAEFSQLAMVEEEQLRLQSRILWLNSGDSNTQFFHRSIKGRQKRNFINSLTINNVSFSDESSIRQEASSYFQNFYLEQLQQRPFPEHLQFPTISPSDREQCEADFSEEEIRQALNHSKAGRAPGPDGFTMDFYKDCWHIVGKDVVSFIREIQEQNFVDWRLNNAFITLIPKSDSAVDIREFRPISLINCGYKIFSKIMATRIKGVISKVISPAQNAFVAKRQIIDGVLIAAECIDSRQRSRIPGLICKLDIEKAFDCVNWQFLLKVMTQFGFGIRFRKWIQACLLSARFSVMINGKPGFLFTAERGLRQGDPMSPYLFLMVIEVLNLMIYSATENNWIQGFSPGTCGLKISHLQFADDTMVFLNATAQEVCILKLILRNFELTSGLRINLSKSSLIPVGNCSDLSLLAGILGCKIGDLPFDYLGLPLGTPYKASGIWQKFMDRLENRLAGWKRNSLSKGGRLTLIRSCLMSLPIYFLSLFPIPSAVSLKMERLVRNFLWGESATKKALCLVRWDVCKKPTVFGGLSIRGFNMMNRSLLAKWIWRFTKEHSSLWRAVILSKHGAHKGNVFPKIPSSSHGTGLWKHISRESVFIHQNSSFELGNGKSIRFWHDKWCCPQTVRTIAPNIYRIAKRKQSLVSEIVKLSNGQLIIEMDFYSPVEYTFMSEIVAIHNLVQSHPIDPLREDVLCWEGNDRDLGFSVSDAYMKLSEPGQEEFPVKEVWLKGIPLKVQFFIWTAFQDRIATIDLLIRRRKIWVNHCCLCLQALETSAHLLVHCEFTRKLWYDFLQLFHTSWVMPSTFADLVLQWKCKQNGRMRNRLWKLLLPAIAWAVWGERNSRSFEGKASSVSGTILAIKALIHSWCLIDPTFSSDSLEYFLFNFNQLLAQ